MQLPQWQTKSQQWLTDSGRRSIRATKRPKRKWPMVPRWRDTWIRRSVCPRWLLPTQPHKREEESCEEACCPSQSWQGRSFLQPRWKEGEGEGCNIARWTEKRADDGCVMDAYKELYMHDSIVCHFNLLLHIS